MGKGKRLLRNVGCGCLSVVVIGGGLLIFTPVGRAFQTLWKRGFFESYVNPDDDLKYKATETDNLKALYTAMMLYHESEGQFPVSSGWMDAIKPRIQTSDLAKGEAEKKLISPSLAGKTGQFGYAMNDLASGKYKGDLKDPKTILIFDSGDTMRNAHGDPKKLTPTPPRPGGNMGISIDGTVVKL